MPKNGLHIVDVTAAKLGELPCCGIMNTAHEGHRCKREWLAEQLDTGLRARVLFSDDDHQCGYIEYVPGEQAWRAVDAAGYMFVHCIWTFYRKYQRQGNAAGLLQSCIDEAKKAKMRGVAVLARKGPWLASSDLFLKCGFEVCETATPDYELLVKKFKARGPAPRILPIPAGQFQEYGPGLTIIRADQCPHTVKFAREIADVAKSEFGLEARQMVLGSHHEAQNAPTPYAVFSIVYNGTLLSDHQISKTRFRNIMNQQAESGPRKGKRRPAKSE
jgi:hypothetical protein